MTPALHSRILRPWGEHPSPASLAPGAALHLLSAGATRVEHKRLSTLMFSNILRDQKMFWEGGNPPKTFWRPWGESNTRTWLRRPLLYPLSYRGFRSTHKGFFLNILLRKPLVLGPGVTHWGRGQGLITFWRTHPWEG